MISVPSTRIDYGSTIRQSTSTPLDLLLRRRLRFLWLDRRATRPNRFLPTGQLDAIPVPRGASHRAYMGGPRPFRLPGNGAWSSLPRVLRLSHVVAAAGTPTPPGPYPVGPGSESGGSGRLPLGRQEPVPPVPVPCPAPPGRPLEDTYGLDCQPPLCVVDIDV